MNEIDKKINLLNLMILNLNTSYIFDKYHENATLCSVFYNNIYKSFPEIENNGFLHRIKDILPELYMQKPKKRYVNKKYKFIRPCRRLWWNYKNIKRRIKACEDAKLLIVKL